MTGSGFLSRIASTRPSSSPARRPAAAWAFQTYWQSMERAAIIAPSRLTFSDKSVSPTKYSDNRPTRTAISGLWIITEDGPTTGGRPRMPATSS